MRQRIENGGTDDTPNVRAISVIGRPSLRIASPAATARACDTTRRLLPAHNSSTVIPQSPAHRWRSVGNLANATARGTGLGLRRNRAVHLFHEGAAAQHPLVGHPMFAAPVEIPNDFPPSRAPAQTAPLQVCRVGLARHPRPHTPDTDVSRAANVVPKQPSTSPTACHGRGTRPMRALCPVQGYSSSISSVLTILARRGLRWTYRTSCQQVGLLFHQDGLVPILEEMACPLVAPIEPPGVPC